MAAEWALRIDEEGPAPMALGERIRQLRKETGWSQAELGDKVGTDSQRISRYENGRITPSLDAIVRIAEALNVSIDHLLVDNVPRRPLHSVENALGDRLAVIAELGDDELATLNNVIDGLVARNRLRALTGGIS